MGQAVRARRPVGLACGPLERRETVCATRVRGRLAQIWPSGGCEPEHTRDIPRRPAEPSGEVDRLPSLDGDERFLDHAGHRPLEPSPATSHEDASFRFRDEVATQGRKRLRPRRDVADPRWCFAAAVADPDWRPVKAKVDDAAVEAEVTLCGLELGERKLPVLLPGETDNERLIAPGVLLELPCKNAV